MTARVINVMNRKGGVGKTSAVVNLAAILAEAGRKVLVIDMDSQANATRSCHRRFTPQETVWSIFDEPDNVMNAITPTAHKFDLMMGDKQLAGVANELNVQSPQKVFANTLKPLLEEYDIILIDSPPELGFLTISGLTASTEVLIPVQCEPLATDGTAEVIEMIQRVQSELNSNLRILGAFMTMYQTVKLHRRVYEAAEQYFRLSGVRLLKTTIRRSIKFAEANELREPAVVSFPKHEIVNDYRLLAAEVFGV